MDKYWNKLKEDNYEDTFDKTSDWLINTEIKLKPQKERKNFSMMTFIKNNKYKFAFIILILAVFGACNYPVMQNDTVGYVVKWSIPAETSGVIASDLTALPWLKNTNLISEAKTTEGNNITEYSVILQNTDEKTVMSYKNDLEKIQGIKTIKILPVNESVTRPVYSAVLYSFFKIDIKSNDLSEEEVSRQINTQLKEAGIDGASVYYENTAGGIRRLMIKMPENQSSDGNKKIEVNIDNKNGREVIKMKTMKDDRADFKNMTDEEIRKYIKEKNREDNLQDREIKIERRNGKVMINVDKETEK
jgi:hypothetical protein